MYSVSCLCGCLARLHLHIYAQFFRTCAYNCNSQCTLSTYICIFTYTMHLHLYTCIFTVVYAPSSSPAHLHLHLVPIHLHLHFHLDLPTFISTCICTWAAHVPVNNCSVASSPVFAYKFHLHSTQRLERKDGCPRAFFVMYNTLLWPVCYKQTDACLPGCEVWVTVDLEKIQNFIGRN